MAYSASGKRTSRLWPGLVAPVGLTFLLGFAIWLFAAKAEADNREAERTAWEFKKAAKSVVEEILSRATERVAALTGERREARRRQENNLRQLARSVLDAVHHQLTSGLDRLGQGTIPRRDIGRFPAGLDGPAFFLALTPPGEKDDLALATLRASQPDLASLLPSGCSLSIVEDNSRELLSLGREERAGDVLNASMTRELIFNNGRLSRYWSVRVDLAARDENPSHTPAELAELLSELLSGFHNQGMFWVGWLLGQDGKPIAPFPNSGIETKREVSHSLVRQSNEWNEAIFRMAEGALLTGKSDEWIDTEIGYWAWVKLGERRSDIPWRLAAIAIIEAAPTAATLAEAFWRDQRWSVTLIVLLFFSLTGWIWFFRSVSVEAAETAPNMPSGNVSARIGERTAIRLDHPHPIAVRLKRDESIPEVQGDIVAEIGPDGRILLLREGNPPASVPSGANSMPSGSLRRLQNMHRGQESKTGSRILDYADSPLLRELAARVRPQSPAKDAVSVETSSDSHSAKAIGEDRPGRMRPTAGWIGRQSGAGKL
ncbi:MAG: hypothetical protein LBE84_04565 [Planctomycetota bacterium]|jgi:hypothetical protein|nr:hypothetical protein [Planctomycetota bacterium]